MKLKNSLTSNTTSQSFKCFSFCIRQYFVSLVHSTNIKRKCSAIMITLLFADTPGSSEHVSFLFISPRCTDNLLVWYSQDDDGPVIKTSFPRGLCPWMRVRKFLQASLEGGVWRAEGRRGAIQQLGRLADCKFICLFRCRGILMVRPVLHFNKPGWESAHWAQTRGTKGKKAPFTGKGGQWQATFTQVH